MSDRKCQVCGNNSGIYICPRCNIFYCSVSCYKNEQHLQCSESFYEKCVQEELASGQSDPEVAAQMIKILKRNQMDDSDESSDDLDSDDEDPEEDISKRMANINFDNPDEIWKKLTCDEKEEFKKLTNSGQIFNMIPEWEPWWLFKRKKVQEVDFNGEEASYQSICPPVLTEIPTLANLTKVKPSACVPFILLNILLTYVFTLRWFKGKHLEMPVEAVTMMFKISETLKNNKAFENLIDAFMSFEDGLKSCKWFKKVEENKSVASDDVINLVQGPCESDSLFYVRSSLSDLKALFHLAIKALKDNDSPMEEGICGCPPKLKELKLAMKKIEYYLSWTIDHGKNLSEAISQF